MTQTTTGSVPAPARVCPHTPGPWNTLLSPGDVRVFSFAGQVIADVRNPTRVLTNDHSEEHANALLIAAAPSLLATLRALLACYVTDKEGPSVVPYMLGPTDERTKRLWWEARLVADSAVLPAPNLKAASRATQVQMFYQEQRNIAEGNALMLEMIEHGDITDRELDKLIARRPEKYSRFAPLRQLCRKETPLGDALDTLHAASATERGENDEG